MTQRFFRSAIRMATVAATTIVAACSGSTDVTIAQVSVRGTWSYVSSESGRATSSVGTLTLSQDSTVNGGVPASRRRASAVHR